MSDRHECDDAEFPLDHWSVTHRENEISSVAPASVRECGLEKSWTGKKKCFQKGQKKRRRKEKRMFFFFFFSSKDNKCRKTTKDLGVMVHYHVCSFSPKKKKKDKKIQLISATRSRRQRKLNIWYCKSPVIWTRVERTHLWVDIGRRYAQQTALVRGNMSKLYYVIPTILLQGKGIDWKTAFASSHLFPLPPQC